MAKKDHESAGAHMRNFCKGRRKTRNKQYYKTVFKSAIYRKSSINPPPPFKNLAWIQGPRSSLKVEGLIEPQWWSEGPSENSFRPRPLDGWKTPLSKKIMLLYVLVYMQQFGAENISVENAIFVIAFRIIFEKVGGYSPS